MRIERCKVDHLVNPMGYAMEKPVFSWVVMESDGTKAEASRLIVKKGAEVLADTGWVDLNSLATSLELPLEPRTRYTWTVAVRTDAGEEAVSRENWFETGRMQEVWTGQWIGCDDAESRLPLFSKAITPAKPVRTARLYICGLGLYEAFWNGGKIGAEYMTPYCTNYDAWVQYQTFDVTAQLQQAGELSVLLGNGWYKGRFGFDPTRPPYYGDSWKLIADLVLTYEDGAEEVIGTDESWQVTRSNITFSNIYDGEIRDDTLPVLPAVSARLTDAPKGRLTARLSTSVTVREERKCDLIITPAGETVLDTRQNLTGSFRLRVHEPKGTRIRLQFGEILQNDCFYRDNLRSAKAEYIYISDGEEHVLEPDFTFYGYRYVKIEGVVDLNPDDFTALVLYSELPRTGWLTTGNELVNQLISNAEWGQLGNFLDVPTDCPQRDERMGWTGDAQVFAPTACFQRDCAAFYAKYLHDMDTEQRMNGGEVLQVIPSFGNKPSSTAWGDAACVIPWTVYEYTGDPAILEKQFGSMCAWVDFMERLEMQDQGWRSHFHFGDWLALDCPKATKGLVGATDRAYIALTYFRYSAELTARAARVLGKEMEAIRYQQLADALLETIRAEYFTPNGRCAVPTQTGYLLALRHGLTTDVARTRRDLAEKLNSNDDLLETGFVGTPLLCEELTRAGYADKAFKLLLHEGYPGWLYAVKMGATTIWERWNSVLPDGSISGTDMNSLNHYSYGAIVHWLYQDVAGIAPLAPGFTRARLAPHVHPALGKAEAVFDSAAGQWKVCWELLPDGRIAYACTVPFGCEAEVSLPNGSEHTLTAGSYEWIVTAKAGRKDFTVRSLVADIWQDEEARALLLEAIPLFEHVHEDQMPLDVRAAACRVGWAIGEEVYEALDRALMKLNERD